MYIQRRFQQLGSKLCRNKHDMQGVELQINNAAASNEGANIGRLHPVWRHTPFDPVILQKITITYIRLPPPIAEPFTL